MLTFPVNRNKKEKKRPKTFIAAVSEQRICWWRREVISEEMHKSDVDQSGGRGFVLLYMLLALWMTLETCFSTLD